MTSWLDSEATLAGDETDGGIRGAPEPSALLERGASIGRYVVVAKLGVGGMGVVHSAYDPELDRAVALKVLVPQAHGRDDETPRQRLLREAQAMARVSHPNVVAVHDVGVHEGRVFVAMELVEGSTLTRWLTDAPRTVAQIVDVFVQAGRGLAAAHAKGLVHRDFKPDNVMIGHDHGRPRAQVMDFGLARASESSDELFEESMQSDDGSRPAAASASALSNDLTRVGQVIGTPRFMAPEQHLRGEVDARTDQFAFCVALWLAVYGQHPFGGETPTELAGRVIAGRLVDPPAVPGATKLLRAALRRGLAPEREARWPSMAELLAQLERDPSRTRRRIMAGVAVVALAGAGVGVERVLHARAVQGCADRGASIESIWTDEARERVREGLLATGLEHAQDTYDRVVPWVDQATAAWSETLDEACLAAEVEHRLGDDHYAIAQGCLEAQRQDLEAFLGVLATADRAAVHEAVGVLANLPSPQQCLDEGYLSLQPKVAADPALRAEQRQLRGTLATARSLVAARRFEEARAVMDELQPRLDALPVSPLNVDARRVWAKLDEAAVRFDDAQAGYREAFLVALELGLVHEAREVALDLAELLGNVHERYDDAYWWLDVARALSWRLGQNEESAAMLRAQVLHAAIELRKAGGESTVELAQQALASCERLLGPQHPTTAYVVEILAAAHRDLGHFDRAVQLARQALALREAALGPVHPQVQGTLEVLAETLRQVGETDESLAIRRRALKIAQQVLPPGHPGIGHAQGGLGLILQELGQSTEALPLLDAAVQSVERALGPDHPDLASLLINRGNALQSLNRLDEARACFERVIALVDAKLGPDHPARSVALTNLGITAMLLEDLPGARKYLEQALAEQERLMGPDHPNVGLIAGNLGQVLLDLELSELAIGHMQRALTIMEKAHGPDHPDVAFALVGLAEAQLRADRPVEALALSERALKLRQSRTISPFYLAVAQWMVARSLRAAGRDEERARALAEQALPAFVGLEGNDTEDEIRRFLGKRR